MVTHFNDLAKDVLLAFLWLLSNGKLLPGYEFWVTNHMRYMFCHVNNLFLVSQPYSHSNYKEILPIYWMTPVFDLVHDVKAIHGLC